MISSLASQSFAPAVLKQATASFALSTAFVYFPVIIKAVAFACKAFPLLNLSPSSSQTSADASACLIASSGVYNTRAVEARMRKAMASIFLSPSVLMEPNASVAISKAASNLSLLPPFFTILFSATASIMAASPYLSPAVLAFASSSSASFTASSGSAPLSSAPRRCAAQRRRRLSAASALAPIAWNALTASVAALMLSSTSSLSKCFSAAAASIAASRFLSELAESSAMLVYIAMRPSPPPGKRLSPGTGTLSFIENVEPWFSMVATDEEWKGPTADH
mmetsp:Transcript_23914/g.50708  ORF Transcript_23914/g.50708 Transcript_23914/m.50708 type:complete len:279 (-) Transcript_23914:22-858(-)